jgi:predicted amidohydrolase YtcJ
VTTSIEPCPDRPVLLAHVSGHAVAANSLALALAGIGAGAPDLPGRSAIERDAAGEPTGILRGPDAWDRVAVAMPAPTASQKGARRLPGPRPGSPPTA